MKLDFSPMGTRRDGTAVMHADRGLTRVVGLSLHERGNVRDPQMLENLRWVFGNDNCVF